MKVPRRRIAPHPYRLLFALLGIAAILRFYGIEFGLPGKYRPDEEFLVSRGLGILHGELNPHFFQYPSLYMYLLAVVYGAWRAIGESLGSFGAAGFQAFLDATGGAPAHLVARQTTALLGVAGVAATYRLGREVAGSRAGVLAALLLAFNYSHVRESHFATTDVLMVLLATLALAWMIRVARDGRLRDSIVAGAFSGLAFSSKYPALALAVPLALSHLWLLPSWRGRASGPALTWPAAARRLALAFAAMALCFAATSPYVLLDWKSFRAAMAMESTFTGGLAGLDAPYGLSWLFGFALRYGAGIPFTVVAMLGLALAVRDLLRRGTARAAAVILLSFAVAEMTPFVLSRLVYVRYALVLLPILSVLAARAILAAAEKTLPQHAVAVAAGLALLVSVEPGLRAIRTEQLFRQPDTRNLAREFIAAHVPPGSRIAANAYYQYAKPELPNGCRYVDFGDADWTRDTWALVDEHPIAFFSPPPPPAAAARLASAGTLVADFDPFVSGRRAEAVYDPADAFYVPLAGQGAVRAPGPRIRLYRLTAAASR